MKLQGVQSHSVAAEGLYRNYRGWNETMVETLKKGTVKMERSFREKSKWKRQEFYTNSVRQKGHYVKEIDIIRLKYLSR